MAPACAALCLRHHTQQWALDSYDLAVFLCQHRHFLFVWPRVYTSLFAPSTTTFRVYVWWNLLLMTHRVLVMPHQGHGSILPPRAAPPPELGAGYTPYGAPTPPHPALRDLNRLEAAAANTFTTFCHLAMLFAAVRLIPSAPWFMGFTVWTTFLLSYGAAPRRGHARARKGRISTQFD